MIVRIGLTRAQVEVAIAEYVESRLAMEAGCDAFEFEDVSELVHDDIAVYFPASVDTGE